MNHGRHRWPQFISPFAIGLGADAALGVLFAPHSGEDTRKYLRDAVQDGADEAVSHGNTVMRRVSNTVDDASFRSTKSRTWPEGAFREVRNLTLSSIS